MGYILSVGDLVKIHNKVNKMVTPGRIPTKISSNVNDFTADEWKNILACIKWFERKPLPDNEHNWLGETIDFWSHSAVSIPLY